jgi:hypothetical protein
MIPYKITSAVLGVILFLIIFMLVRRGRLQEKHSLIWFFIGIVIVFLGLFPGSIDLLAGLTGISYAPTLLLVIAVGILLIQNVYLTIASSQNEIRLKELSQQTAVLTKLIEELKDEISSEPARESDSVDQ